MFHLSRLTFYGSEKEGYMNSQKAQQWGWVLVLAVTCGFWWEAAGPIFAQSEQVVEVTIKNSKFVTKQGEIGRASCRERVCMLV